MRSFDSLSEQEVLALALFERFGGHIPLIRRQDVNGFVRRHTGWSVRA
jgi:hypothetical protein